MSEQKMIVVRNDETIELVPYIDDIEIIQKAVGGYFEVFQTQHFSVEELRNAGVEADKPLHISFYCNEEFLFIDNDKCNTLNGVGTFMNGSPIYGDIAILAYDPDTGESRGLERETDSLCECLVIEDAIAGVIRQNSAQIQHWHDEYDNNKPKPHIEFYTLD